jgi:hypothetical protein
MELIGHMFGSVSSGPEVKSNGEAVLLNPPTVALKCKGIVAIIMPLLCHTVQRFFTLLQFYCSGDAVLARQKH